MIAAASHPVPAVALTAVPAHVALAGSARTSVRVASSGKRPVVVDVSRAGFALDVRGRPRLVRGGASRSAARWLTFRPRRFVLRPHAATAIAVVARVPRRAEPGDHDALLILRARPLATARVAVRFRMGIVVVVRAPGKVVRRLELRRLSVVRGHALAVVVANRGNVTESLTHARAIVSLARSGRRVATLVADTRELRPRTVGVLEFRRWRRLPRAALAARIVIPPESGRGVVRRDYWIMPVRHR
jgi:hypothetical protein